MLYDDATIKSEPTHCVPLDRCCHESHAVAGATPKSTTRTSTIRSLLDENCYLTLDEMPKGKRAVDKNTESKGSNIHVIACISENDLAFSERRFGSFTSDKCNEFMQRLVRHISLTTPLNDVIIVADNAPFHANVEDVFKEEAFSEAKLLRLGPYSPMLNPIENCFSTFKAMVK
ncbi:Replication protein A 70 kDa DNA-binding subunit [Phytophthora cinnamomi]|uniref:Replication protein A 70 kDa DNA-binding subunit n=1 Tax=Phytophthora cinnamomi TaxID=4785 RepID=UPI003559C840|nr:Replication protein A 70 kDa DNA-binding subunit [Phytophthora cinnamomi]